MKQLAALSVKWVNDFCEVLPQKRKPGASACRPGLNKAACATFWKSDSVTNRIDSGLKKSVFRKWFCLIPCRTCQLLKEKSLWQLERSRVQIPATWAVSFNK